MEGTAAINDVKEISNHQLMVDATQSDMALPNSKSLGTRATLPWQMIIFFSTSLSWRATVLLLIVQLALGFFQSSFHPYQVILG